MLNQLLRYLPLARLVKAEHAENVLEVGSGPRGLTRYLPGQPVVGVDLNFREEDLAGAANYKPVRASALSLPFEDSSFPVVVSSDMLEHIPSRDREAAVKELWRVASKKIFLAFPVAESHARWERRLIKAYEMAGKPLPDWLAEHAANGLPAGAEMAELLRRLGMPFRTLPNENNLVHFAVMLAEMTFLCPWLNYVSDIMSPDSWETSGHSRTANLARLLLVPFRGLPVMLSFGSPVRRIFVISKEAAND